MSRLKAIQASRQFEAPDISVAVTIEGGLITPIMQKRRSKSPLQRHLLPKMKDLADRAKAGKLPRCTKYQGGKPPALQHGLFGSSDFRRRVSTRASDEVMAIGAGEKAALM